MLLPLELEDIRALKWLELWPESHSAFIDLMESRIQDQAVRVLVI